MIYYPLFIPEQERHEFSIEDSDIILTFSKPNATYTQFDDDTITILGGKLNIYYSQLFDESDEPILAFTKDVDVGNLSNGSIQVQLGSGPGKFNITSGTQYMWDITLSVQTDELTIDDTVKSIALDNRMYNYFCYNTMLDDLKLLNDSTTPMYPLIYTDELSVLGDIEVKQMSTYHLHFIPHVITDYRDEIYISRSLSLFNVSFIKYTMQDGNIDINIPLKSTIPINFIQYTQYNTPKIRLLKEGGLLTAYTRFDGVPCLNYLAGSTDYKTGMTLVEVGIVGDHLLVDIVRISDTDAIVIYITGDQTCKYCYVSISGADDDPVITVHPIKDIVFNIPPDFYGNVNYDNTKIMKQMAVNIIKVSNGNTIYDALLLLYCISGFAVSSLFTIDWANKEIHFSPGYTIQTPVTLTLSPLSIFQDDTTNIINGTGIVYTAWETIEASYVRPVIIQINTNLFSMADPTLISFRNKAEGTQLINSAHPNTNAVFYMNGTPFDVFYFYKSHRYTIYDGDIACFKLPDYFGTIGKVSQTHNYDYEMVVPYSNSITAYMYWQRDRNIAINKPNILGIKNGVYVPRSIL